MKSRPKIRLRTPARIRPPIPTPRPPNPNPPPPPLSRSSSMLPLTPPGVQRICHFLRNVDSNRGWGVSEFPCATPARLPLGLGLDQRELQLTFNRINPVKCYLDFITDSKLSLCSIS